MRIDLRIDRVLLTGDADPEAVRAELATALTALLARTPASVWRDRRVHRVTVTGDSLAESVYKGLTNG